ncbi:recombinase family protein [Ornithinimicrobium cavernae]|uniref:recombinase family protein n=1 Tax=Ornithinimicrobium cavernae TaxID=2666047 RepID=UPI00137A35BD|nr:recombinase family protein [Ornithinimicrobium cavernae]
MRVSTERQVIAGYSLPEQRLAIEAECKRRGWVLLGIRADEGVSGKKGADRKEWEALLDACRVGAVDAVVVTKIDRFSRSAADMIARTDELTDLGVTFVSIAESMDLSTPAGRFMRTIYAGVAENERETLAARSAMGLRGKARAGLWPGGEPPLGYRVQGKRLELDPDEIATLRRMARLVVEDGCTTGQVAAILEAEGVRGRKGGRMTHQNIRRMLSSPALRGEVAYGKLPEARRGGQGTTRTDAKGRAVWGEPVVWQLEESPLTGGEFEALQRVLASFSHGPKADSAPFPLTGMMLCSCGAPFGGTNNHGYRRYRCRDSRWFADGRARCAMPMLKAGETEDRVWKRLYPVLASPSKLQRAVRTALAEAGTSAKSVATDLQRAEAALARAREGVTETITAAIRAGAAPDLVEAAVRAASSEAELLAKRAERLRTLAATEPQAPDGHLAALCRAAAEFAGRKPEPARLRQVLSLVGARVEVKELSKASALDVSAAVDPTALALVVGGAVTLGDAAPRCAR